MTAIELTTISLAGRSADELEALATRAALLARDLRAAEPSVELALTNGVSDRSYSTVGWGMVTSYTGEAIIELADGRRWRAIGHRSRGTAEWVSQQGYVEFVPLDND